MNFTISSLRKLRWVIAATALSTAALACQIHLGGPLPPGDTIQHSSAESPDLESLWEQAIERALNTGEVMVLIDEGQLTDFLQKRSSTDEEPVLQNPEIYLRQNVIHIYGVAERGPFEANAYISVEPIVDADGKLAFELIAAEFGPIPAPEVLKDTVSAILTEAFTGTVGSLATGIRVTSIAITDGQMAIVGTLR